MKRKYLARLDNGHDFTEVSFMSEHRRNSIDNEQDLRNELYKKWGKSHRAWKIVEIKLDSTN